ncbi:hypothetical protein PWG15_23885 (plasmid) [Ensifer adhaerens]|uniref:hypothetical protein n=1 Tax=Ensifer adhaerens TaxID=106592 RepID=UPI0023A98264|nr:hypothetical protein [Ensifer adhaerens]WDZ80804.1 hypothetical protein PWG15_23885 [Ensifer adhaerens]
MNRSRSAVRAISLDGAVADIGGLLIAQAITGDEDFAVNGHYRHNGDEGIREHTVMTATSAMAAAEGERRNENTKRRLHRGNIAGEDDRDIRE